MRAMTARQLGTGHKAAHGKPGPTIDARARCVRDRSIPRLTGSTGSAPQRTCGSGSPGRRCAWHSWLTASDRSRCSFVTESPSPSCSSSLRAADGCALTSAVLQGRVMRTQADQPAVTFLMLCVRGSTTLPHTASHSHEVVASYQSLNTCIRELAQAVLSCTELCYHSVLCDRNIYCYTGQIRDGKNSQRTCRRLCRTWGPGPAGALCPAGG